MCGSTIISIHVLKINYNINVMRSVCSQRYSYHTTALEGLGAFIISYCLISKHTPLPLNISIHPPYLAITLIYVSRWQIWGNCTLYWHSFDKRIDTQLCYRNQGLRHPAQTVRQPQPINQQQKELMTWLMLHSKHTITLHHPCIYCKSLSCVNPSSMHIL